MSQPISGIPVVPPEDGGPAGTPPPETLPETPPVEPGKGEDTTDWQAEASAAEAEADKWRSEAKKWEQRARDNQRDDKVKKSLEEKVAELEQRNADRDERDRERSGKLALQQIRTDVAKAGIDPDDVEDLLATVDPARFLDQHGDPDLKAIKTYSSSLTKFAGRITPDPDQGKTGGKPQPNDMTSIIRRAAGVTPR